ncbi:hypothetical protein C0995_013598 [Termitomyces sp. Mi166|nr:hypothetical protein C0995_013598 [Termitomyces sp. Mi166\
MHNSETLDFSHSATPEHFCCPWNAHPTVPFNILSSPQPSFTSSPPLTSTGKLYSNSAKSFIINVTLWSTSTTYSALVHSGTSGMFVSSELSLSGKEVEDPIELQLFDSNSTFSSLVTCHYVNVISIINGLNIPIDLLITQLHRATSIIPSLSWLYDANSNIDWRSMTMSFDMESLLGASISLKSRHMPSVEDKVNIDCPKAANSDSVNQSILRNLKEENNATDSIPNTPSIPKSNPEIPT